MFRLTANFEKTETNTPSISEKLCCSINHCLVLPRHLAPPSTFSINRAHILPTAGLSGPVGEVRRGGSSGNIPGPAHSTNAPLHGVYSLGQTVANHVRWKKNNSAFVIGKVQVSPSFEPIWFLVNPCTHAFYIQPCVYNMSHMCQLQAPTYSTKQILSG